MNIPDQLLNIPIERWQLNGVTLIVIIQLCRGAWTAWKTEGGLRGVLRALIGTKKEKTDAV